MSTPDHEIDRRRAAPTTPPTVTAGDVDTFDEGFDQDVDQDIDVDETEEQDLQVEMSILESADARAAGLAGLSNDERDQLEAVAERIARRATDEELIAELRSTGFTGPGYEAFADDLARYAFSVLGGWLRTGHIFSLTRAFSPSDAERLEFADSSDSRKELAAMTIAIALPKFRDNALVGGGWVPEKGASITTYFMRACVFAFPNQLRAQRRQRKRWRNQDDSEGVLNDLDRGAVNDPADLAVGNIGVMEHLRGLDERSRRLVVATLRGYSQAEMLEMFPEESVRAVEGVLYRWRTREQKKLEQPQSTDQGHDPRKER